MILKFFLLIAAVVSTILLIYEIVKIRRHEDEQRFIEQFKQEEEILNSFNNSVSKLIELFVPKDVRDEVFEPILKNIDALQKKRK